MDFAPQPIDQQALSAEGIVGAALEWSEGDINPLFWELFQVSDWHREAERAYPPNYVYGMRRFPCPPGALAKLRRFLRTIPRARPEDYEILLNIEGSDFTKPGPTWDIVKWMAVPEVQGFVPGIGSVVNVGYEPFPVYHISALERGPLSLSDRDWDHLRKVCTTGQDPREISERLLDRNMKRQMEEEQRREDWELDFAEYYRDLYKVVAEELGI